MKINPIKPPDAVSLYKTNSVNAKKQSDVIRENDILELSDEAKTYLTTIKAAKAQGSSIRAEKVAGIKKAIENGTYKVDSTAVAEKMIQDSNKIRP